MVTTREELNTESSIQSVRSKKCLLIPGYGTVKEQYSPIIEESEIYNIDVKVFEYDIKSYRPGSGTKMEWLVEELHQEISKNSYDLIVAYSLGALILFNYLNKYNLECKCVTMDPVVAPYSKYLKGLYYGLLDYTQVKFGKNHFKLMFTKKTKFRFLKLLYFQLMVILDPKSYNFQENDKPIEVVWGEKDMTCPIENYNILKRYYKNIKLTTVKNGYHTWISQRNLINEFLVPAFL